MEGMALELNGELPKLLGPVSLVHPFLVAARLSVRIMRKEGLIMAPRKKETLYSGKLRESIIMESGETLYRAPIEVSGVSSEYLAQYQISKDECKPMRFSSEKEKEKKYYCCLTENKAVADFLWAEVNTEHSRGYRKKRCMIPGRRDPLIKCPDTNRCCECPYPAHRDEHDADEIGLERMEEDGCPIPRAKSIMSEESVSLELEEVCKLIRQKNPKYEMAIVLKEYFGYSVKEIAEMLDETERNIYYFLKQAKEIGKKYNADAKRIG